MFEQGISMLIETIENRNRRKNSRSTALIGQRLQSIFPPGSLLHTVHPLGRSSPLSQQSCGLPLRGQQRHRLLVERNEGLTT
jgi:hypothetical protein